MDSRLGYINKSIIMRQFGVLRTCPYRIRHRLERGGGFLGRKIALFPQFRIAHPAGADFCNAACRYGTGGCCADSNSPKTDGRSPPSPTPETTYIAAGSLTGRTILVDPGHGGYDGGARCRDSGVWEKEVNLAVALAVEKSLTQRGATVLMTRRTDTDLCDDTTRPANVTKKRQDMQCRVDMAVQGQADMVLSIHMNEYRVRSESGPQVFYRAGSGAGRLLAGTMQEALITALSPQKERAAMPGDYFILQLDTPSVLVECGFISNPAEEALLLSPAYQEKLGEAIADGAAEYFRLAQAEK